MRSSESKGVRNWIAVLLLCVLIFLPSLVHVPMPRGPFNDKVAHLLVYAVAGFLVLRGARSLPLGQSREGLPIGVQFAAGYGQEKRLLELAFELEEAMPWARVGI